MTGVIDRFLEHARVLYFYHGGDERLFISSADWMPRNLDRRVELLVPVEDSACRRNLISILKTSLADNVKARRLLPSGHYEAVRAADSAEAIRSQEVLYRRTGEAIDDASRAALATFEPLRAGGQDDLPLAGGRLSRGALRKIKRFEEPDPLRDALRLRLGKLFAGQFSNGPTRGKT